MMTIPGQLFKYEPPTLQSLRNLKTQTLFFGSPRRFNDPYDCAITPRVKVPTADQISNFRRQAGSDARLSGKGLEELSELPDDQVGLILKQTASSVLGRSIEGFLNTKGVTCFSETNANLLMWSHYAGRGKGFCLEFDTQFEPFDKLRKVEYSADVPEIDLTQALLESNFDEVLRLYCTKSKYWEYELEWRGIHKVADTSFTYDANSLRAVYFGSEVAFDFLEIVCLILLGQNKHVRFFRGARAVEKYAVEFEEFKYTPHIQAGV